MWPHQIQSNNQYKIYPFSLFTHLFQYACGRSWLYWFKCCTRICRLLCVVHLNAYHHIRAVLIMWLTYRRIRVKRLKFNWKSLLFAFVYSQWLLLIDCQFNLQLLLYSLISRGDPHPLILRIIMCNIMFIKCMWISNAIHQITLES